MAKLVSLVQELEGFAKGIYVDGSYVTDKLAPNDIDGLIVLPRGFNYSSAEGRVLERIITEAERNYLDLHAYEEETTILHQWVRFFSHDRDSNLKGIVYIG